MALVILTIPKLCLKSLVENSAILTIRKLHPRKKKTALVILMSPKQHRRKTKMVSAISMSPMPSQTKMTMVLVTLTNKKKIAPKPVKASVTSIHLGKIQNPKKHPKGSATLTK